MPRWLAGTAATGLSGLYDRFCVASEGYRDHFSTKLAIWDWPFGTAHRPGSKPSGYGYDDPDYPRSGFWAWLQQHAYAFRRATGGAAPAVPRD